MKIVGLTGGIACGKSSVSRELHLVHGLPIIDADEVAHDVQRPGTRAYRQIIAAFGDSVLGEDGSIDRAKLGPVVFADPAKRRALNGIMHPEIGWSLARHLLSYWLKGTPVIILDAPLLFESGLHRVARCVVTVTCTRQQQLERLVSRDGLSLEEAERRVAAQMPVEEKARRSQYVVDNSGPWSSTVSQVSLLPLRLRKEHGSVIADVLLTPGMVLLTSACAVGGLLWHLAVASRR